MSLMSTLDMKRVYKNADKSTSAFRSRTAAHGHEADVTSRWTVGPGAYEISSFFSPEKLPKLNAGGLGLLTIRTAIHIRVLLLLEYMR